MAYKIVKRHFLDEDPDRAHDNNCKDIVYMIDTGYGKYPRAFSKLEDAQAKLEELINTRN
jgi:hypothetical protein